MTENVKEDFSGTKTIEEGPDYHGVCNVGQILPLTIDSLTTDPSLLFF
jgi:hypothetical protein